MRFEIPSAVYSWMVEGQSVEVTVGEHSVDTTWQWWRPWMPKPQIASQPVLPLGLL